MIENKNIYKGNENPNTESKKLDSNGDEIVWELNQRRTFGLLYSWVMRIGFCMFGIYCIIIGLQKYLNTDNNGSLITIILVILALLWFVVSPLLIYRTLNLKTIFLVKDSLVLQKYIGRDIMLPLGSFYIDIIEPVWLESLFMCDDMEIIDFNGKSIYHLQIRKNDIENLNQLYTILNPFITKFLVDLSEQDYKNIYILSLYNYRSNLYKNKNQQFSLDKIDKLREEK